MSILRKTKSCGIFLFNKKGDKFLLMKHPTRWDIPKGHKENGESDMETAIREFEEETGISRKQIKIYRDYEFELKYETFEKRYKEKCDKTLVVFLAKLREDVKIKVTEHEDFKWFLWNPPHKIQEKSIDPLLKYTEKFFRRRGLQKLEKIKFED
jgi:8-oxo-dGTP pyrophosphatase MutT (NUDIX family)